jgi:tetratricopeptide repeat protein 8
MASAFNSSAPTGIGGGSGTGVADVVGGGGGVRLFLDPLFHAHTKFKRRDFDGCIDACSALLAANPYDQAVWFLKCRALTEKAYIDDADMEEEGVGEMLLDDNAMAQAPRPGTSLARPATSRPGAGAGSGAGGDVSAALRPMTQSGRPLTGFARPGTSSRAGGAAGSASVDAAFRGARPGTSRPLTALGRQVRLGTASMLSVAGGPFINVERLDLRKYAARPALAKALCDYILYVDHNPRKGLELAAAATVNAAYSDWWWKARLGKCYYQLGLLRDAEKQFRSALRAQEMVVTVLELAKVYIKLDQPATALGAWKASRAVAAAAAAYVVEAKTRFQLA